MRNESGSSLTVVRTLVECSRDADRALGSLTDQLDPLVRAELEAEQRQFEEDLLLLESLQYSTPESTDAAALAASLAARIRRYIERNTRLYGVLRSSTPKHPEAPRSTPKHPEAP